MEAIALEKLRRICLALPQAVETTSFGHPTFRAGKKTFAVLEWYKGELCLAFKVGAEHKDLFLRDSRFFSTPYIGKHGWISLRITGRLRWTEVKHLVTESYGLVTQKRR